METAQQTNKLIVESRGTEETVYYTKQATTFTRHASMCLKREPKTCHWCGDSRGPHPWHTCPAKGKGCSKCGGYVVRSPAATKFVRCKNLAFNIGECVSRGSETT